jgi:hypothetical protein
LGVDLSIQVEEIFAEPSALLCRSDRPNASILISPVSPREIRKLKNRRSNRLSEMGKHHPLLSLPRNTSPYELSVLNAGIFFDLELQLAWQSLTGRNTYKPEALWIYVI